MKISLMLSASRFAIVGVFITLLHISVATTLITLAGLSSIVANSTAFVVANATSYVLHTCWSFAASPSLRSGKRFIVVSLVGLILTSFLSGSAQWLGFPYGVGIALVVTLVPASNFLLHRFWTYRQ